MQNAPPRLMSLEPWFLDGGAALEGLEPLGGQESLELEKMDHQEPAYSDSKPGLFSVCPVHSDPLKCEQPPTPVTTAEGAIAAMPSPPRGDLYPLQPGAETNSNFPKLLLAWSWS